MSRCKMSKCKIVGIVCIALLVVIACASFWIWIIYSFVMHSGASDYQSTKRSLELQELLKEHIEVGEIRTDIDAYGAVIKTADVKLPDYSVLFFLSTNQANEKANSPEKFEELMLEEASQNLESFMETDLESVFEERELSLTFFAGEEKGKTEKELRELIQQKALDDEMAQAAMLLMMAADGEVSGDHSDGVETQETAGRDNREEVQP
ncbi:MAG: hypothetical protein ACI39W_04350 [Brotaphodocola sp.]